MTSFDYERFYSASGYSVYVGSQKRYPAKEDFLEMLEEKEGFLFDYGPSDVDSDYCRHGPYTDEFGENFFGYSIARYSEGPGSFKVWVVRCDWGKCKGATQ